MNSLSIKSGGSCNIRSSQSVTIRGSDVKSACQTATMDSDSKAVGGIVMKSKVGSSEPAWLKLSGTSVDLNQWHVSTGKSVESSNVSIQMRRNPDTGETEIKGMANT